MFQQDKCCGCIPVRTGSIIIAVLIIGCHGYTALIIGSFGWYKYGRAEYAYSVFMSIWGFAEGTCLLIGALLNNSTLALMYVILAITGTITILVIIAILGIVIFVFCEVRTSLLTVSNIVASLVKKSSLQPSTLEWLNMVEGKISLLIFGGTAVLVMFIVILVIVCIVRIYSTVVAWNFYKEIKKREVKI